MRTACGSLIEIKLESLRSLDRPPSGLGKKVSKTDRTRAA